MKNTTFRKKALLSSVAMLLVALVALGSATFAWFSSNKTVTADGMSVKAAAAKGLVINKDNQAEAGWKNAVTFTQPDAEGKSREQVVLTPVSIGVADSKFADNAYYPEKVDRLNGGAWKSGDKDIADFKATTVPAAATSGEGFGTDGYFAVYEVAVKSTGEAIPNVKGNIKYTAGSPDAANYIRIAVLDDTGAIIALYGDETNPTAITNNSPVTATPQTALTAIPSGQNGTDFITISSLKDAKEFTVVVWFEGQDENCVDANQQAVGNISLKFSY